MGVVTMVVGWAPAATASEVYGTLGSGGANVVYTADPGEANRLVVLYDLIESGPGARLAVMDQGNTMRLGPDFGFPDHNCRLTALGATCPAPLGFNAHLGDGNDTAVIESHDPVFGVGAQENWLWGGPGDDILSGDTPVGLLAVQTDTLIGESGNDTLLSVDGAFDRLQCGPGSDTAIVDSQDDVAADCELVLGKLAG